MPTSSQYQSNDTFDTVAYIQAGQTTSQEIDLGGVQPCGFFMPAAFTGTALKFLASPSPGGIYLPMMDGSGAEYTIIVAPGQFVIVPDVVAFAGVRWLKVVSNAAEAAQRSIPISASAF